MLDSDTKRRIDTARDILVGKVPDPKSQVEQITIALIYKFMDDMDAESEELGGKRKFFTGDYARYGWAKLMRSGLGGHETLALYSEGITKMPENAGLPPLFRDIFKNAYLPYRDPETLRAFLKIIDEFTYDHSERLGDAFEYLLSVLGSQGDAGQFRTPRHIIDFMVALVGPRKDETVLDPACGTAGFLISAYKHILRNNSSKPSPRPSPSGRGGESGHYRGGYDFEGLKKRARELRKSQTEAENFLWELLRDRQLMDAKFRRQHQFGDYICDFYCHEAALVVECDGDVHLGADQKKHDAARDAYLHSQGLRVLRFTNAQVLDAPSTVLDQVTASIAAPDPLPSPFGRGAGGEGKISQQGDLLTPEEKGRLAKNFKGYDISPDMVRLSLVNLYLHGFTDPHIHEYDSLTSEERWNEFADVILANPPFMSPKGGIKPHKRFSIQAKRSEVLFVDYITEHLKPGGRAAIIVPEGIIFQSQTAYKELRKLLVDQSLVAVISLPAGCFNPYSGVKTSILLLDKDLAPRSDTIAFFKVENDGFGLGAQRRAIDKNDLPQVQADVADYLGALRDERSTGELQLATALIVSKDKIAANGDYNLSGERYSEKPAATASWPLVALGDLTKRISGGTPSKENQEFWAGSIPWVSPKDMKVDVLHDTEDHISDKAIADSATSLVPAGTLLCVVRSGILKHSLPLAITGREMCFNQDIIALAPSDKRLDVRYLFSVLRARSSEILAKGIKPGVTVQSFHNGFFKDLQIPLPPLEVQKEIVAEIEGYQKVINGARAVIDNYRPHISVDPTWQVEELKDVSIKITDGAHFTPTYVDEGIPFLRVTDLTESNTSKKFIPKSEHKELIKRCHPEKGDVLYSKNGTIGVAKLVDWDWEFSIFVSLCLIKPKKDTLDPSYLTAFLNSDDAYKQATARSKSGTVTNLHLVDIKTIRIPLPPLTTQRAIVAEIEAEQALVAANRELIARMEKKIQATLARVWGDTPAAEPAAAAAA